VSRALQRPVRATAYFLPFVCLLAGALFLITWGFVEWPAWTLPFGLAAVGGGGVGLAVVAAIDDDTGSGFVTRLMRGLWNSVRLVFGLLH
jgi:hypothetical protein